MTPLVIYHGGCDDGFTAAWVARKALPDAEFRPYTYEMPPPTPAEVTGRDLYVLDFSFNAAVMGPLADEATKVVVLDHHKSAQAALQVFATMRRDDPRVTVVFDQSKSGAVLAWDHFNPSYLPPSLVRYVQDRDLWKWELPSSREFSAYLRSLPRTWEVWDAVHDELGGGGVPDHIEDEGGAIIRYQAHLVRELAARAVPVELFAYKTLLADAPLELHSEVAKVLAEKTGTFGVCFAVRPADNASKCVVQFGLRSVGDFDVAALATRLGGGGHKNAAGFERLSPFPVTDLRVACQQAQYKADPVAATAVMLLQSNREQRRDTLAELRRTKPAQHKLVLEKMDELKKQANEGGF